ncbi:MAG: hypothetical protein ACPF9D_03900 [Owenweeksia sp.]
MGSAADGAVIDSDGNSAQLHDFLGGKPTVLSFIFTTYNVQNEVRISFDAIWYKNFFWLITPFEENF